VPYAVISGPTRERLGGILDPGLEPANPLDMWGASERAQWQLTESLVTLAEDPAVAAVALAVDLLTEFDGDRSYPLALLDAAARTGKPLAALANVPATIDPGVAAELRGHGIPVLEAARRGCCAAGPLARGDPPRCARPG
jgi:acetate---CoA ligase (ADP-forming)